MNEQEERLRQHPDERFLAPLHHIDLGEIAAQLLGEALPSQRKHRQETLYRHGPVTVALFLFDSGAHMAQHVAEGVVTVHVLEGRLRMTAEGKSHDLSAGQLLVMAPGVRHDVHAEEATRMLLTVCLNVSKTSL
ncbi:MAG: cupin domain-containing protein [Planctomycetes bacterium]|nr:cupin domain-containing protein [Planctomycetota bacterium]